MTTLQATLLISLTVYLHGCDHEALKLSLCLRIPKQLRTNCVLFNSKEALFWDLMMAGSGLFSLISQLFLHYFIKSFLPNYFSVISYLFHMCFPLSNYFSVISHLFLMYFSLPNNFLLISHCYFSFLYYISQPFLIIYLLRLLSC